MATLEITTEAGVARVWLARPEVRNAFNEFVIRELRETFTNLSSDGSIRAVVLAGKGKVFCGGADVHYMRDALDLSYDNNVADAEAMSNMFRAIDQCSKPVIGRIHGAALGGGAGLVAVCDVAIATEATVFGFTEVKLGIIPAVISPFVIAKIGASHARALFLTGERFDAELALQIGLIHEVIDPDELDTLDTSVDAVINDLRSAGPRAVSAAKALIPRVAAASYDETLAITAQAAATARASDEGQAGMRAFLEHRPAPFDETQDDKVTS
jgi:methylglutaconyl-CoA hydratase